MKFLNYLFILLLLTSSYSCTKKQDRSNNNSLDYIVNGISTVTLAANGTAQLTLETKYISGNQEQVTLGVKDIPANVSTNYSSVSGTPTFTSILSFDANGVAEGSYQPSITITTASGNTKSLPFELNITPAIDCRGDMKGSYHGISGCSAGHYFELTADNSHPDRIILDGHWGSAIPGDKIYAIVDCKTQTFTIPEQTANFALKMSGSGSYDTNTKTINLTYTQDGQGTTCTATFAKL